ncbi:hypothetical protein OFB62_30085, partial [Escherichia coli]|nr:hypothetical protein [Escherichia coli]
MLDDFLCWRNSRCKQREMLHWRTVADEEISLVIEADGKLLPFLKLSTFIHDVNRTDTARDSRSGIPP